MFVLGLNRAHRSGAGHALARTLVRAAILTAGAHSRQVDFVKQCGPQQARLRQTIMTGPQRRQQSHNPITSSQIVCELHAIFEPRIYAKYHCLYSLLLGIVN